MELNSIKISKPISALQYAIDNGKIDDFRSKLTNVSMLNECIPETNLNIFEYLLSKETNHCEFIKECIFIGYNLNKVIFPKLFCPINRTG